MKLFKVHELGSKRMGASRARISVAPSFETKTKKGSVTLREELQLILYHTGVRLASGQEEINSMESSDLVSAKCA